eukprot:COSAG04_NODE_122_length_24803_cov_180.609415_6_plen_2065_part_01
MCPTPLPAEWWVSTCAEVDVTSAQLVCPMLVLRSATKLLGSSVLESASWLDPVLTEAVHICKVNASAGLSARPTMCMFAQYAALSLVETAARVESHATSLLDSGVLEALDYACVNDFSYIGASVSSNAAGAVVALVGRNEGGKTLSRSTVNAMLDDSFADYFDPTHFRYTSSAANAMTSIRRVATVAIADANKKIMLQHEKLLDSLVTGLLLDDDNPRRGQDGADAMQEACASVLHELALYGPGAAALRAHKPTMDALRVLAESGTKESRERAAGALFELDEETRAAKTAKASDAEAGSSKPPPHIMVSYNWDHQHVILRVVAWLQAHGYLVWVDTEQMKGSTVDAMALAVEGSEVMLIGVSRPYKESSNCRMEAQYGLQKKKAMIPLMMQEGYEADGWLGLLLGTSLWYALYGSTLESESAFEDRMSALSREIGPRGRADAVVVAAPSQGEEAAPAPEVDESDGVAALRVELAGMRVTALQKRARSEGVTDDAADDAMDDDNPKPSLIALIVDAVSSRGPADRLLSALTAGGDTAADALSAALDHAMDVLEQASMSAPRKGRKSTLELMESVEALSESVDDEWCDGVSRCGWDRLQALASRLMAVQALKPDKVEKDCASIVSSLLESLCECGSVVVQCDSVLGVDGSDESARLSALECVRGLSPASLGRVSDSEASLFGVLKDHLCGEIEYALSGEERLVCWLSLFVLGCRNGVSVVARVDVLEPLATAVNASIALLGEADMDGELRVCAAAHACGWGLAGYEGGAKSAPDVRAPVEKCYMPLAKLYLGAIPKAHTADSFGKVIAGMVSLQLLGQEAEEDSDVSVGCGAALMLGLFAVMIPKPLAECDTATLCGTLTLLRRVSSSPRPAEWWVSTCAEADVASVRLTMVVVCFACCAVQLEQAALESASWLGPALAEAVHICKVNASAGLSARPTMSFYAVAFALNLTETATRVESHGASLLDSGVLEALDYACVNDFTYHNVSVSGYAAGAVVALVGRNEGGKTLSRTAVNAVLGAFAAYFDPTNYRYTMAAVKLLPHARRAATVAIADANKKLMLQYDELFDSLIGGLLLDDDNPRRGQDGADALQEACAGVLHELALYGPGAAALRSHKPTMDALRVLAESGTKESRERAAGALFELDEEARAAKTTQAAGAEAGSSKPPPHVMVSYNWDHQHVILRVVAWLQAHGYLVWVDTEQMKGSTVDAMALAVEGSEVMLIGVSRPYKESSNCRMEAQYGLQKKKAMIPLMLQEGYEADGWLGLLLGTSLWYALYGPTLESESSFEDRMSALSRELGVRGRADAVVAADAPEPYPQPEESSELRMELEVMRLTALQKRAVAEGVSSDAVDDAMDSDDPKASLVSLIVEVVSSRGPSERILSALQAGGETAAESVSAVLDHAMDVLEHLSVSSPRKARKSVREVLESAVELMEGVDDSWCDGVSQCGAERLEALADGLLAVQVLTAEQPVSDSASVISSLLECLRGCSSVAVQCSSVLAAAGSDEGARLCALECVRALPCERLESVSADESAACTALCDHVLADRETVLSSDERACGMMAVFALGCRNGLAVTASPDLLVRVRQTLMWRVYSELSSAAPDSMSGAIRVASAAGSLALLVTEESPAKSSPEVRAAMEKAGNDWETRNGNVIAQIGKDFTVASTTTVITDILRLGMLEEDDVSLGCGSVYVVALLVIVHSGAAEAADDAGWFCAFEAFYRRVCPTPPPTEWWLTTCDVVDVVSVQLCGVAFYTCPAKYLAPATLDKAAWLAPMLLDAVRLAKLNASAGLSARPTICQRPIYMALGLLETAARVDSHVASLLELDVIDALEYGCVNDFVTWGISVSAAAAGAVVALVGRNEGGKTLSRSTANAVVDNAAQCFDKSRWQFSLSNAYALAGVRCVVTMAISDANKKIMLQHDTLLGTLVAGLIIDDDNPRRGQDGADALQEASAGVLHELALYGPGAAALRSHKPTMDALRVLAESGTKESRERAAGALFELDLETRAAKAKPANAKPGSSKPPPHIMVSYNWDHQHVVLRVVAWLQAHGYLVWVDTEQMKGSTVDTMALAV